MLYCLRNKKVTEEFTMKFIVCKDYDEMSRKGAEIIAALLKSKPDCVLGLATGSTPVGMYKDLA